MTTQMVRKNFYIYKHQADLLKRLAQEHGVSESEIIRRLIDRVTKDVPLLKPSNREAWTELLKLLESRKSLGMTGEPYRWNRQEIYEERESRWLRPKENG